MKDNKGIILFALIVIGLLWYLSTRKQTGASAYMELEPDDSPIKLQPNFRMVAPEREPEEDRGRRYRNNETWEIEWTPDGLPGKVTIHRDATQT